MPEVLTILGYKIYFWLNEGNPLEPFHVHVSRRIHPNATKLWILANGDTRMENNRDRIPSKDLRRIRQILKVYHKGIESVWLQKFNSITYKND